MKILIVSFYYSPELGAAPSRITNMAEGLKSQGAEVDVLTCLPNYPQGQIFEGFRHADESVRQYAPSGLYPPYQPTTREERK